MPFLQHSTIIIKVGYMYTHAAGHVYNMLLYISQLGWYVRRICLI